MANEDEVILTIPRKLFRRLQELARRRGTDPKAIIIESLETRLAAERL